MRENTSVTATRVFADAARVADSKIERVQKLNGANSVWLATSDTSRQVLKYFDSSHHGHSHFGIEDDFFRLNSSKGFLPPILFRDPESNLLVTPFLERRTDTDIALAEVLKIISDDFWDLQVPISAHVSLPGILSWWRNANVRFSLGEQLVIDVIRRHSNLHGSLEKVEESWFHEATIHGDMKLANLIIGETDFWFIDWESVSTGIKDWDVAGLIQSCIVELVVESPLAPWVRRSSAQLKEVLAQGSGLLFECVAARLMQSAVELSQGAQSIPSWSVDLLQAADDISKLSFDGLWNILS